MFKYLLLPAFFLLPPLQAQAQLLAPAPLKETASAENAPESKERDAPPDAEILVLDLDNFVTNVFKIIKNTKLPKPENLPLYQQQQKQKALAEAGHPFTVDAFLNTSKAGELSLVLDYLDAGMDVHAKTSGGGTTALHFAVLGGMQTMVQLLLRHGADPNTKNTAGETPLHLAVARKNSYIVALLLADGADANITNRQGWSSMHIAANDGSEEIFALMENQNGNINKPTRIGMTPLMLATWKGHTRLALYLIAIGADTTATDPQGNNAFLLAVTHERPQVVEFLLAKGADPNQRNMRGWSAIEIALKNDNLRLANVLYAAGAIAPDTESQRRAPTLDSGRR